MATPMPQQNEHFGESRYDSFYCCNRCCYCDGLAPTSCQQEAEWKAIEKMYPLEPKTWHTNDFAHCYDYKQVIHPLCRSSMNQTEQNLLRKKNRNNIILPKTNDKTLRMQLEYLTMHDLTRNCMRCDESLGPNRQGYSFDIKPVKYIHYSCSIAVLTYRKKQAEQILQLIGNAPTMTIPMLDRFNFIQDDVNFFIEILSYHGYEASINGINFVVNRL
jgi:hypothetical protein